MKKCMKYILFVVSLVAFGQAPYRPTEEELRHQELLMRKRERSIDPLDFFQQIFSTKILFYGQVIDWNGIPVEGAEVTYSPAAGIEAFGGKTPKYTTTSGKNGLFDFKTTGIKVYVSVKKDGYRQVSDPALFAKEDALGGRFGSSKNFDYFNGGGHPELNHHPVEKQPVQFVIRKIGKLEPLVHREASFPLTSDGRPEFVSLQGASGGHRISIICRSDCRGSAQKKDYSHFSWSFELMVENGGVIEQIDDGYEAPLVGYASSVVLASANTGDAQWSSRFNEKKYYIRFDDGVCARVIIEGRASYVAGENRPYIYFESYLNPKSRNLETPPVGQ